MCYNRIYDQTSSKFYPNPEFSIYNRLRKVQLIGKYSTKRKRKISCLREKLHFGTFREVDLANNLSR